MNTRPVLELVHAGRTTVTILVPPGESYDLLAQRIADAIEKHCGTPPIISRSTRPLAPTTTPHVIALGCLANNPFIETLYFRWQTLVDRWFPGTGGWVIQTHFAPLRPDQHVLLLGGSDSTGVKLATDRFIRRLETIAASAIPWWFEVKLGESHFPLPEDRLDVLGTSPSEIATPECALPEHNYVAGFNGGSPRDHLLRLGMYGPHADNFHLCRSSELGLRYAYTGQRSDGERYRETLLSEVRSGVLRKLYHYKSLRMFQLWSVFGSSPLFSLEESTEITDAMEEYLFEESGIVNRTELEADGNEWNIFNRHIACDAMNLWVGSDSLWRLTGDASWLEKQRWADVYFESQEGIDVPLTGLTEGYATYLDIYIEWMLLSRPEQIATHPHILLWANRLLHLCTNMGELVRGPQTDETRYPYNLLRKLAYLLSDGRYLFVANLREIRLALGMDRVMQFSSGQAYAGDVEPTPPESGGLITTPPNERLRKWQAPSIDPHKGFDRITARSGWQPDDDYLMIIGMRGGGKALPNVGTLAAYECFGQRLITSDSMPLYPASVNPWHHSAVCIDIGGLGPGLFSGAEILANHESNGGHLVTFQMTSAGQCHWYRTVFWKPHSYVMVIDQAEVETRESFTIGLNWRCGGRIRSLVDNLATLDFEDASNLRFYVQVNEGLKLSSEIHDYPALGMPADTPPTRETLLHALTSPPVAHQPIRVATLLHPTRESAGPQYHLETETGGLSVRGPDETLAFQFSKNGTDLKIASLPASRPQRETTPNTPVPPHTKPRQPCAVCWSAKLTEKITAWTRPHDGTLVIGLADGTVSLLDIMGNTVWTAFGDSAITAISCDHNAIIVGCQSGLILHLDHSGQLQWQQRCRFRNERIYWPYWFLPQPEVVALAMGRDENRNLDLIVAGTGSTNLVFLNAATGEHLDDVISPYGLPDRIRVHPHPDTGESQFLVGHSRLTCCSSVRVWNPQAKQEICYEKSLIPKGRTDYGWDSCSLVDFQIQALKPDQPERVIVLRQGAVNQLTVYDQTTANPLWDATLGGAPVALVVQPSIATGLARCFVADQFGGIVGFDAQGERVFSTRLGPSLLGMSAAARGSLIAWSSSQLHLVKDGRHIDSLGIKGLPLGFVGNTQHPGFFSSDSGQLHYHEITW